MCAERAWAGLTLWGQVAANAPQWQEDTVLAARTVGTSNMGNSKMGNRVLSKKTSLPNPQVQRLQTTVAVNRERNALCAYFTFSSQHPDEVGMTIIPAFPRS